MKLFEVFFNKKENKIEKKGELPDIDFPEETKEKIDKLIEQIKNK